MHTLLIFFTLHTVWGPCSIIIIHNTKYPNCKVLQLTSLAWITAKIWSFSRTWVMPCWWFANCAITALMTGTSQILSKPLQLIPCIPACTMICLQQRLWMSKVKLFFKNSIRSPSAPMASFFCCSSDQYVFN